MSLEALWSVIFVVNGTPLSSAGGGVVVIDNGRVLGGDVSYTYVGSIHVKHDIVTARVHVRKYQNVPGVMSVTGLDNYHLTLEGKPAADVILLSGTVDGQPSIRMNVEMRRRAEIE